MKMAKHTSLPILTLLLLLTIITKKITSARTIIGNSTPTHNHHHHHHNHHKITFLMRDVLINVTDPSSRPATTTKIPTHIPFQKPIGLFPPNGGIPLSQTNPSSVSASAAGMSTQTLDIAGIGLPFTARATHQELEFGIVTVIDEDLYNKSGSEIIGRAKGIYVASSEDGSSHMIAMTTNFEFENIGEVKDGLRFFGVHQRNVNESHIAVIGGLGNYDGANGYATVKALKTRSRVVDEEQRGGSNKFLKFKIYLS